MRILVSGSWYSPLSSRSIYEPDYHSSIRLHAKSLYPQYQFVKFDALVESEFGNAKADFALIDVEYRGWTVVEVELEHHPLSGHVVPQLRSLVNGRYTPRHSDAIWQECKDLDAVRLQTLVESVPPDFLVIVPKELAEWRSELNNLGVRLQVVEVFTDQLGKTLLSCTGDNPRFWDSTFLSTLSYDRVLPRALKVDIPSCLSPDVSEITAVYGDALTRWKVVRLSRAMYITPRASLDIDARLRVSLVRGIDGNLHITNRE